MPPIIHQFSASTTHWKKSPPERFLSRKCYSPAKPKKQRHADFDSGGAGSDAGGVYRANHERGSPIWPVQGSHFQKKRTRRWLNMSSTNGRNSRYSAVRLAQLFSLAAILVTRCSPRGPSTSLTFSLKAPAPKRSITWWSETGLRISDWPRCKDAYSPHHFIKGSLRRAFLLPGEKHGRSTEARYLRRQGWLREAKKRPPRPLTACALSPLPKC